MKKTFFLLVGMLILCPSLNAQNLILNGSFENNSATGDTMGLTSNWSTIVKDSWQVDSGTMDLIDSNDCSTAADGKWWVSCTHQVGWPYLAFSLKLSQSLTPGTSYFLSFNSRFCGPNSSPVVIGLSTDSVQFGTGLNTFAHPIAGWTTDTFTFIPTFTATFLIVKVGANGITGTIGLDDFILETSLAAAVNTVRLPVNEVRVFPTLVSNELTAQPNMEEGLIEIMDLTGRVLQTENINAQKNITLNVSRLTAGLYFLKVKGGQMTAVKFVKM